MSTRWTIKLTTNQRVSLGTGGEKAFLTRSHPFIPGSVVRGALAAAWVREGNTRNADFERIFEHGRFSHAFPQGVAVQSQSAVRKKYGEGTAADDRDLAFDSVPKSLAEEQLKGDCDFADEFTIQKKRTVTATAMEPRRHVAKDGSLYSREALEKGTEFIGTLVLPDGVPLGPLMGITTIFVGGRSSVMGRTTLQIVQDNLPTLPTDDEIIIRTLSHTILVDEFGVPVTSLKQALTASGIDVVQEWASRVDVDIAGGWHAASGMPKPKEIGLAPGATAKIKNPPANALQELLDEGIGLRRSEGYGWIEIVDAPYARPAPLRPRRNAGQAAGFETTTTSKIDEINEARFTNDQRQWLANMLRQMDEGENLTDRELGQPVAGRLSFRQTEIVTDIVRNTRQDQRQSLAHAITRGGAR